ncbi:unnamed protein product, partial [Hydatigera taeniaeformis]|uniref:Plexin_cytopl domain-containing protein n=1 Tax=Hydatigena taeniaeformis TaxID=6205 RepID=A0A0R3WNY0_HYDTA
RVILVHHWTLVISGRSHRGQHAPTRCNHRASREEARLSTPIEPVNPHIRVVRTLTSSHADLSPHVLCTFIESLIRFRKPDFAASPEQLYSDPNLRMQVPTNASSDPRTVLMQTPRNASALQLLASELIKRYSLIRRQRCCGTAREDDISNFIVYLTTNKHAIYVWSKGP